MLVRNHNHNNNGYFNLRFDLHKFCESFCARLDLCYNLRMLGFGHARICANLCANLKSASDPFSMIRFNAFHIMVLCGK